VKGLRTRQQRRFRENLKRAGIWAFLIIFTTSILGVTLIAVTR
jgi:hypothetical protein